jgi:glycosyltransferase involved in cell wall biosynthesis
MTQPSGPSILALVGDMSGPALWRVLQPFTALQKLGYPAAWDFKAADGIGAIAPWYDVFLLSRLAWPPRQRWAAEAWFSIARRAGKVCIYDADDDIFNDHLTHRSIELDWTDGKTRDELEAERIARIWALRQCDGVTVSTPRLATVVRSFTDRPVIVVPNAIDVAWFSGVVRATVRQIQRPTIGWAGGQRPDRDVATMAEAWGRIARRRSDVSFVVAGHFAAVVASHVPHERLAPIPWLPLEQYPSALAEIDIACCSVSDEPFNRCKSVIKAYEAALAGSAVVASPTLYGSLIEHGQNGYLASTVDEWDEHLTTLLDRPSLRSIMATRLRRHVERRCSLRENLWRWPSAWSSIERTADEHRILYGVPNGSRPSGIILA